MHQLNALDSGCLTLESTQSPFQVGGLYVFSPAGRSATNFNAFKEHVSSRVGLEPILRQRLSSVPFELDNPYWVDDEDFNLDLHLSHIGLPNPAEKNTLLQLAMRLYQKPLDRNRALWEIHFIDGLDRVKGYPKGAFALVTKIHYTLIHSRSGERLFASLMDFTAKPRKIPTSQDWNPTTSPTAFEMLVKSYQSTLRSPLKLSKLLLKTSQSAAVSIAKGALANLSTSPTVDNTPASIFDSTLDKQHIFYGKQFKLEPIKKIKEMLEDTHLNDVVLAICSGALRSYLLQTHPDSLHDLIALLPIAVKEQPLDPGDTAVTTNTQVTGTLMSLATLEQDPIQRLKTIKDNYRNTKPYKSAVPARQLADYIPSIFMSMAAKLYTRWHYSESHNPYFNLVINHIPGPQIPLYLNGARLLEQYNLTPIFDGLGLVINVTSYHGKLGISLMTSNKIIPDIVQFFDHIESATQELAESVKQLKALENKKNSAATKQAPRKKPSGKDSKPGKSKASA